MKRILFLHPNFPGQFKLISRELSGRDDWSVAAIGRGPRASEDVPNVAYDHYDKLTGRPERVFPPLQSTADNVRRGRSVADLMRSMESGGFRPNYIVAHPGWGDATFVKDVFPEARFIAYMEYFYRAKNSDVDFDPEFAVPEVDLPFVRLKNVTNLLALAECDVALTPTTWQRNLFPQGLRSAISVLHEGIDCAVAAIHASASFNLPSGEVLSKKDEVVTFVCRSLEPYRGFHIFMRCLPHLLADRPGCRVVIVGAEGVSYGRLPSDGRSWKSTLIDELGDSVDWSRVHFVGRVPYAQLISLFNVSSAHVYLTYPFVLSWSLLDAMGCGCAIVAADVEPVREVVTDKETGLLVDFFSPDAIADRVSGLLEDRTMASKLGARAREFVVETFDFKTRILPRFQGLLREI